MDSVIEIRDRLQDFKFPSRRHPSYCTIARAVQRLYKTGSCHRRIPLSRATPSSLRILAEDVLGLWSNECQFSSQGTINTHNTHYWSLENPYLKRSNRQQVRWLVNVWCGIWKSSLSGPTYFDGPLTSESYTAREILSGPLANFLEAEVFL
ncbi:uncharacterized protein TNCV_4952581 [Trichonephila clavipes]|nr:uncharacterized protein TNCV_4952581 [Trichonephila clavipes]